MTKKIFIIALFVFLIVGIFFIVRMFLSKNDSSSSKEYLNGGSVATENGSDKDKDKETEKGLIEKVVEGVVKEPIFNSSQNKIFYFDQGNFISSNLDGKNRNSIGAYPFKDLEKIEWSSDKENAIVKNNGDFYVFNIEESEAKPFKSNADNLVWGKINNQLIYKFYDPVTKKRTLNISDITGASWQEITEIPFKEAEIRLNPKQGSLAVFSSPKNSEKTQLFTMNLISKEKKEFQLDYKGANYLWSPDGKKLLFSYVRENGKINLAVMEIETETITELNFPGLADKCVWLSDSIDVYCASPTFKRADITLPDDWKTRKDFSTDTFWKINTIKGEQERLIELGEINEDVDAISLFLDKDESYLFFVDRKTNDLFRVDLNK
ncbi:MAG: hypothetical protein PF549_00905 [Patescibacteria group bacterium]|jgi:translation elongation factor P/translation initiation factor 5A|nr:hypothetical protein [Patescibacteria group bacterium]